MDVALLDRQGPVAVVTLNRPEVRNAVNTEMAVAVGRILEEVANDREIRAVVITGAGDKSFCAGADLKAIANGAGKPLDPEHPEWGFAGVVRHEIDKPLIAAVNGFALGGGTEIALASDLVVASTTATFGLPEVKRGIVAGAGGLVRLKQQIPLKVAMRLTLTGEPMSAAEAGRWGLVNEVVEPEEVLPTAIRLGECIAQNAPVAVRWSRRVLLELADGVRVGEQVGWRLSGEASSVIRASADLLEGTRAFAEKRAPQWQGA
ncbi:enoyl-CoA hydratase-related protein [Dactylosporangium sp. AC04546]|uniref:enoyl-CoA hydratase-related protein n=1 Tax=Dactylosporangium sp. AC04546 TaxID=2862460 RepID=UPI001EDFAC19|nr:enoyl-CoA hydratase-related protein [Dactylosporangium sp. AC04546]WVK86923.1 enoyl-CoA hydratase-related protein [Dactylosporangium sp. AC04546]